MKRLNLADVATRFAWTFIQALAAGLLVIDSRDLNAEALQVAIVAAGLSALKTIGVNITDPRATARSGRDGLKRDARAGDDA